MGNRYDDLYWNYFDESGEIQIGWAYDSDEYMQEMMQAEGLTEEEFYEKYAVQVLAENEYSAGEFSQILEEYLSLIQSGPFQNDLQHLINAVRSAAETHDVEYAEEMYFLLHDMDYYLLNYRLDTEDGFVQDRSTISRYYGVLLVYD